MAVFDIVFEDFSLPHPDKSKQALCSIPKLILPAHGVYGIAGQSGCGKTLLLRAIAGLGRYKGVVRFAQGKRGDEMPRKPNIQLVTQNPFDAFNPSWTIRKSIQRLRLKNDIGGLDDAMIEFSKEIGLAEDVLQRFPAELSGGQLQRLSLVRALLAQPDLLLLDEATSGLDAKYVFKAKRIIDQQRNKRMFTVLITEHNESVMQFFGAITYSMNSKEFHLLEKMNSD